MMNPTSHKGLSRRLFLRCSAAAATAPFFALPFVNHPLAASIAIEQVSFRPPTGARALTGFLARRPGPANASTVILLPSQSGPYKQGTGPLGPSKLAARYLFWMRHWHEQGYATFLIDSFSARGHASGYAKSAPKGLNPLTDQALDAYGALAFLKTLPGMPTERALLMGWGHGGTAALSAFNRSMEEKAATILKIDLAFHAAAVISPGCNALLNLSGLGKYKPSGKVFLASAGKDSETIGACHSFANRLPNKYMAGNVSYPEATNNFDASGTPMGPKDSVAFREIVKNITQFFATA